MEEYPCSIQNKDKRYHFFVIIVKDIDDMLNDSSDIYLADKLTGFTVNEWVLRRYIQYYDKILSQVSYVISEYENVTYEEFKEKIHYDFEYIITDDSYISYDTIEMTSDVVYYNGSIAEMVNELNCEYESIEEIDVNEYYASFHLFNDFNKYLTDEFDFVLHLLFRVCNSYVPIIKLSTCSGMISDTSSDLMVALTKSVNFPRPLENYDYYEMISYGYILMYYIIQLSPAMQEDSPPDG